MEIIRTEHLTYRYNSNTPFEATAVDDVSLSIEKGEFVGVIGHTGSGKSTLIQHLNGLLKPTSGKVFVSGQDVWADKQRRRQIRFEVGLVFQYPEYQLFEETTGKDIAFGPKNQGLSEPEIKQRVLEAAELVGLPANLLKKSPFELSGGQKRRAAIAGVIAMRPKVLILDEPAAGLDPRGRETILQMVQDYHRRTSSTILLVSHSMEDTARFANRVLVMNKGGLFAYDTVETIFSRTGELQKMGLSVPQMAQVFHRLAERGIPVRRNIYTVEQAKREIERLLLERGKAHAE